VADLPTFDELFRVARDEIVAKNVKLNAAAVDREGTDVNALVAAIAAAADQVTQQLAATASALFLDSAEADDLDKLVFDRYGLVRLAASVAQGTVNFSTAAAAPAAFNIPVGTLLSTADGVQFETVVATTYPLGSVGPVQVAVRSILAGLDQQVGSGTITSIVNPIAGAPADLTVTNALATFGAANEEDDPHLRERARTFFITARRGTLAAIEAGALTVSGVRSARAYERIEGEERPYGYVTLIVTDEYTSGLADLTVPVPTYETQSNAVRAAVFAALDEYRPAGTYVEILVAQVVLQPVTLGLAYQAGFDVATVNQQVRTTVAEYINALSPGEALVEATLLNRIQAVPGLLVTGAELISPTGNVVPTPLQVLRTAAEIIKVV
jgi:uncharacterized phage protein gp47/JayE